MPDPGPLIAIGGHEDLTGRRDILRVVAARLAGGPLALVTAASRHPEGYVRRYTAAFADLGVTVRPVPAGDGARAVLESAHGVFLSGGTQARLVEFFRREGLRDVLRHLHDDGRMIAGTSAGASALPSAMIARGPELGEGLGLIDGIIIDQHFAERRRLGRLRAAVAADPRCVGIGIDEDTAAEFRGDRFEVHGSGAVTVIAAAGHKRSLHSG